jgi:hypothetical protein
MAFLFIFPSYFPLPFSTSGAAMEAEVSKEEEARRSDKWRADVVGGLLVAWVVVLVSWVLYFHFTAVLPYTAPARAPAASSSWWWGQAWWCFHLASCLWLFQGGTASYFSVPPPFPFIYAFYFILFVVRRVVPHFSVWVPRGGG